MPSGSGSRDARIHTSCAVVVAPTLDRAFAKWCLTVECDRPRRWAAAFSEPAGEPGSRCGSDQRAALPPSVGAEGRRFLDRHMRSLRIKLQDDYRHPRFIASIPGVGYRFVPTFSNVGWADGRDPGEEPRD